MKKLLALSTVGLALLATGYFLSNRSDEQRAPEAAAPLSPSASASEGSAELRRMSRELANVQRQLAALRGQAAAQRVPVDEEEAPELPPENPAESWQAKMDEVSSAFEQEPLDANWAGRMSATLRQAAQQSDALHGALRSIECRSRSCRVEVIGGHDPNVQQGLAELLMRMAGSLPYMRAEPPDEHRPGTTVMYLES